MGWDYIVPSDPEHFFLELHFLPPLHIVPDILAA
jgi:hypothetical protein